MEENQEITQMEAISDPYLFETLRKCDNIAWTVLEQGVAAVSDKLLETAGLTKEQLEELSPSEEELSLPENQALAFGWRIFKVVHETQQNPTPPTS